MDHRHSAETGQDLSGDSSGSRASLCRSARLGQACFRTRALLMLGAIALLGATSCGASGSDAAAAGLHADR